MKNWAVGVAIVMLLIILVALSTVHRKPRWNAWPDVKYEEPTIIERSTP